MLAVLRAEINYNFYDNMQCSEPFKQFQKHAQVVGQLHFQLRLSMDTDVQVNQTWGYAASCSITYARQMIHWYQIILKNIISFP